MKDRLKFVIFEGTGFLGRSLVDNLINENNNQIYVITRDKSKAKLLFSKIKSSNFHIKEYDVNNLGEPSRVRVYIMLSILHLIQPMVQNLKS